MFKTKVRTYFNQEKQESFLHTAGKIIDHLTANRDVFPGLPVGIEGLIVERNAFRDALNSVEHSGRTGEIRTTRKKLEDSVHRNGMYINDLADGDLTILEKSGYPLAKEHRPVGDLPAPEWLHVEILRGGGFSFDVAIVPNYWGYLIAYTETSNTEPDPTLWMKMWSPASYIELKRGFKSGVKYRFAACAVARSSELSWVRCGDELISQ